VIVDAVFILGGILLQGSGAGIQQ